MTKVQIDSWWVLSCVLVVIGAAIIHFGFGVMLLGVLLGAGAIRADIMKEKDNG
jgi:hypothetical protein